MAKVLVLGGNGMLGHMVERVLADSPALVVRGTTRRDQQGSVFFSADSGLVGLRAIFERHGSFNYLVNCVGVLRGDIDERVPGSVRRAVLANAMLPHDVAAAADEIDARVIHVSTDGVFSPHADLCYEDRRPDADDVYGRTKSLGEVLAPGVLNLRCSIVGPDPFKRKGLLEWFLAQRPGSTVPGYTDHMWSGATTLQIAELCRDLILKGAFDEARCEGYVHHVCPNQPISKFQLLQIFKAIYRTPVSIEPVQGHTPIVRPILATRLSSLDRLYGYGRSMNTAIESLAAIYTASPAARPSSLN